jgi:beta-lactamase class A
VIQPRRRSPARGWITLVVLVVVVAAISLGPGTLRDLVGGLFFVRPPAASVSPPPLHADAMLQTRLETVRGSITRGNVATVLVDVQTGASASIAAEQALPAASLFKLPVLIEVLAEEDRGQLDADRKLEIRPEDWTDGSGVLQARVGDRLSVRELTRLMIQQSDNIAALVLLDAVGVASTNATAEGLGLHATRLVDHRGGDPGQHTTSAADMAQLLVGLASGQVINPRVSEAALALLELKQTVSWLGDGLPFWVKVAHKWGDLPEARTDAGVVFTPRGSYVVAVLTEGVPPEESASLIARTSRVGYDYLGSRP